MIAGAQVCVEARRWIGTKFVHQARLLGVGVDCIGLVVCVGRSIGVLTPTFDVTGYTRNPGDGRMLIGLEQHLDRASEPKPGMVAAFKFVGEEVQHVAILGDGTLIHAHIGIGKGRCVEHRYSTWWRNRTSAVFAFPGVAY